MRFLFDCEDEVCLPMAYKLIDEVKTFADKMKAVDVSKDEVKDGKTAVFKRIIENMMVKYPADTSKLLSKLWILEEVEIPVLGEDGNPILDENGKEVTKKEIEKAPNTFKTMATFFSNEVAIDFFTSVMPSLLQISKDISPLLK